jgi:hypothetical protein
MPRLKSHGMIRHPAIVTEMSTRSPVLFIVFNRPDVTAKVFDAIRKARPPKLYVSADGPRRDRADEEAQCLRVREIVSNVDWPCELHTKFNDANFGCKEGVVSGINWFFEHEEEGIILEDDCLPAPDFFRFCDTLLAHYRHDPRVRLISGINFQQSKRHGDASYYFSRLSHIWGWAAWRRTWRSYDKNLSQFSAEQIETTIRDIYPEPLIAAKWKEIAVALQANKIDTWDYQLAIAGLLSGSVSAIPNVNLISNIGFGSGATHTVDANNRYANLPSGHMDAEITHPQHFAPTLAADMYTLSIDFGIEEAKKQQRGNSSLRRKIRSWLSSRLN